MSKLRSRHTPIKQTESVSVMADSKIGFSRKDGVEAEGLISWFVWGSGIFLIVFFLVLFRDPISKFIKRKKK